MLDWKKRVDNVRGSLGGSVGETRSYLGGLWRVVGMLLALYLLAALLVGWFWSQEPDFFPVQQNAREAAQDSGQREVSGYTTVATLQKVAGTLLDKRGGYLSNDVAPPGVFATMRQADGPEALPFPDVALRNGALDAGGDRRAV